MMQSAFSFSACAFILAKQKSAQRTKPDLGGLGDQLYRKEDKNDIE